MAEIVNLRQARKRAARDAAEKLADVNRAAFGLPKAARVLAKAEQATSAARLDGRRLGTHKANPCTTASSIPEDGSSD